MNLKKLKDEMIKEGTPDGIMAQFDFDGSAVVACQKMEELLTEEQRLSFMEKQGCCKSGKRDKDCKAFAKEHKDKPLTEKLDLLKNVQYMADNRLNGDGTISIMMGCIGNNKWCSCGTVKKLGGPIHLTYCGCCGGHFLYHYPNALGISMTLKKVKPGEFVYEIKVKE